MTHDTRPRLTERRHYYQPTTKSLTTIVRAQNDTSKIANIADTIFDRTLVLLIKDVLSVIESANLHRCQNLKRKWSGFVFGLIRINYPFQNCGYIHRRHSSLVQIGGWLHENWENREVLTNVEIWLIPQWRRKWNRNPRADPDYHQKSTTSRRSPLARACQVWSTSVSAFVSYPVYRMTERIKEWQRTIT